MAPRTATTPQDKPSPRGARLEARLSPVQKGLLQISPAAPVWLVGPGGADINPIGGLIGWIGLSALLWIRRRWWSKDGASGSP